MSNKTTPFYRYEANENTLSSVVIALYNEYKNPSNDFDKFSNNLLSNNIFNNYSERVSNSACTFLLL